MASCMQYLQKAMEHQASDVFFVAGKQACEQLDGHMRPLDEARLRDLAGQQRGAQYDSGQQKPSDRQRHRLRQPGRHDQHGSGHREAV